MSLDTQIPESHAPESQVPPLASIDVYQLIEHLAILCRAKLVGHGKAEIDGPHGHGTMQGWALADGVELIRWNSHLHEPFEVLRTPESSAQVWSVLLTDSPRLIASDSHEDQYSQNPTPSQKPLNGMAYLYNHYLAMNMLFEDTGPIRMLLIRLKPQAWQHLLTERPDYVDEFINAKQPRFFGFDLQGKVASTFEELFQENEGNSPKGSSPWHLLIHTLQLCNEIFQKLGERPSTQQAKLHSRDAQRLYQAQKLLTDDFQQPLSLPNICKTVGLGRDKFRQLFQQVYGTTPYSYFQQQRIQEARRLIIEENLNAMEAGYRVGYSHLGHFAQAYKKQFGYLPKDTLKQL